MSLEKQLATKVENCWCSYRDKQMFKLLKHAISSADHSITRDIIKKLNPNEAELLNDPVFKTRIRFRFAGEEFPPYIVFKVYIQTDGKGVKYICGKKTIKPASEAAADSCNIMGNRKFLNQMLSDLCEEQQHRIKDELDISNMKDYMKYVSTIDETNPQSGGKANTWRTLTLDVVPRQHIISDVLLYLHHGTKTQNFMNHFQPSGSSSLIVPLTQKQQVEYINMLNNRLRLTSPPSEPSRRSKKARERVAKMKKIYKQQNEVGNELLHGQQHGQQHQEEDEEEEDTTKSSLDINPHNEKNNNAHNNDSLSPLLRNVDIDFDDDGWEEEGDILFEWTQNLSLTNLVSK